jgi:MinD-like ATPase involved in chromosome partitioning or flagellar assembly
MNSLDRWSSSLAPESKKMSAATLFSTFYSFKGGVGRTLTLVNTAVELTRRGYSVIIWDMDIEAPGIQHIPFFDKLAGKIKGGFVDIAVEFIQDDFKDINHEKLDEFLITHPDNTNLCLLPAGNLDNARDYSQKLSDIHWDKLFGVGKKWNFGFHLFELIRRDILNHHPDFVLIDSPTGYTDIGGVCCFKLPDVVFMVFNYSSRHLKGLRDIYNAFTNTDWLREIREDNHLKTYMIASAVPMDRPDLRKTQKTLWMNNYPPGFTIHAEIPFNMEMAFNETVWPAEYPDHQFCRYYKQVADILLEERKNMGNEKSPMK